MFHGPANGARTGVLRSHAEAEMKAQLADTLGRQVGVPPAGKPATAFEEIVNRLDVLAQRLAAAGGQLQELADRTFGPESPGPSEATPEDVNGPCAVACAVQRLRTLEKLTDWVLTSTDRLDRLA